MNGRWSLLRADPASSRLLRQSYCATDILTIYIYIGTALQPLDAQALLHEAERRASNFIAQKITRV